MPPVTWGNIWGQLWRDASTDHAGRRVWQIGATAADYLTLDFSNTVDTAGAAWADPEVSITLKRGQPYLRVIGETAKMGYEWRIVPNNVATGTWKLQIYNPGTMGTNHSLVSTGPSIQGGRDPTRRDLRRFLPPATDVAVEAGGQNIARSRNASAVTALGRIEQYIPNQDLGTLVEAATVADQTVDTNLQRSQSLSYVLTPTTLDPEPFIAYKAADTVYVLDPPDIPTRTARRIKSLGFTFTKDRVEYPIQLESDSYVGVGPSIAAGVDFLLKEFKAIRERPPDATDILNYFPGLLRPGALPPIVVAAVDTHPNLLQYANFHCDGIDDQDTWFEAIEAALRLDAFNVEQPGYGTILFLDGNYWFDDNLLLEGDAWGGLEFIGNGWPTVHLNYNTGGSDSIVALFNCKGSIYSDDAMLRFTNLKFSGDNKTNGKCFYEWGLQLKPYMNVESCIFIAFDHTLWFSERGVFRMFRNNLITLCDFSVGAFALQGFGQGPILIESNIWRANTGNMFSGSNISGDTLFHGNIQDVGSMVLNVTAFVTYADNVGF